MKNKHFTYIIAAAFTFIAIATLPSCTKKKETQKYSLRLHTSSKTILIPATTYTTSNINYIPSYAPYNIDSFIQAETKQPTLTTFHITSVKLAAVRLTFLDPTNNNNVQNFESISSSFTSDKYTVPYTVTKNAIEDVPYGRIDFAIDSLTELKSYFGSEYTYTLAGKLRKATNADMHLRVDYTFNMEVEN